MFEREMCSNLTTPQFLHLAMASHLCHTTGKTFFFATNLSSSRSRRYLSLLLSYRSRRKASSSSLFHWVLHSGFPLEARFDRGYKASSHLETSFSRRIHLRSHWKFPVNHLAKTTSREKKSFSCICISDAANRTKNTRGGKEFVPSHPRNNLSLATQ